MDFSFYPNNNFGWIDDQREVERIVSQLPFPIFADAAPHLADTGKGKDIFLWFAEKELTGKLLPPHKQTIGDCVSHGSSKAIDTLRFVRIAWQNQSAEDFIETASEAIYGGSRIEIGKGQCGYQDGSVGAWAAQWLLDYGIIHRMKYDNVDLSTYSGQLAKKWGNSGVPRDLETLSKEFPAKSVSLVNSWDDLRDAIGGAKCPLFVCSNQGFTTTRDSQGFCTPKGSWGHCTAFIGVSDNPKRPGAVYQQSWGPGMPNGPLHVTLPHGVDLDLPEGAFLVDAEIVDKMVRQGDSYVVSDIVGYPHRPDDDFVFKFY